MRLSIVAAAVLFISLIGLPTVGPAKANPSTIVSLTFDDGHWSHHTNANPILNDHGMDGTFYINSGKTPETCPSWCWRMTWPQVAELAAAGHDIGGHTLNHVDLTTLTPEQQRVEICDDRQNLLNRGFSAVSFAYPYAAHDSSSRSLVQECGYTSGRGVGGFPAGTYAESIPPLNPFATRTPVGNNELATLQGHVTNAENNGGGWVQINFHEVCDCSDAPSRVTPATLSAFLDWLAPRASSGTVVKTMAEVMAGSNTPPADDVTPPADDVTPPTTAIACNGSICGSGWYNARVTVALSAADDGTGVAGTRYTTDGSDPATSSSAITYTGSFGLDRTTTIRFQSWDNAGNYEATKSQLIQIDTVLPTVTLTSPSDGASVKGKVLVAATAADNDSGIASVRFFVDGTLLATDTAAPYEVYWNTRKSKETQHTLWAEALDHAGNAKMSNKVTVTLR